MYKDIDKQKSYAKKWRENNKERLKKYSKEYYDDNKEDINKNKNDKYQKSPEEKNRRKLFSKNNRSKINSYRKKYYQKNKGKYREYKRQRMERDPLYKLSIILSNLIRGSIKRMGYTKRSRTYEILGCSFDEFKNHLELNFESWMKWENYGIMESGKFNIGWDIDHIIPISTAKNEEEVIKLNHFSNLKPLCSYTNRYIKKDSTDFIYNSPLVKHSY